MSCSQCHKENGISKECNRKLIFGFDGHFPNNGYQGNVGYDIQDFHFSSV
jgi:hypothetical protein